MIIAFVDKNQQRIMRVDIGPEVETPTKMPTQVCAFINLLCDKLNWSWEPLKQARPNTKLVTFAELKEVFNADRNN